MKLPAYRQRTGYNQAIVTLTDSLTKQRRDYWLGEFDSPESRQRYHRVVADWEARNRRLPPPLNQTGDEGPTIANLILDYWSWAKPYYTRSHLQSLRMALRLLRAHFGDTPAASFGPRNLRLVRDQMIRGDTDANPPRRPWCRPFINQQVHRIRHVFKWAASHELLPVSVYEQLRTVEPLRRGRTTAVESEPVKPVADHLVDAIEPFVSPQIWALVQLQRLTGARGCELFKLRAVDIDTASPVWTYSPAEHKTAHHGRGRTIYFGPRCQTVLRPFMANRPLDAYLFSPAEAEADRHTAAHGARKTPLSCGNRPGSRGKTNPARPPGDHYTADSYHRAIERGCDAAFPPPPHLARQKLPARGRKASSTRLETSAEWRKRLGPAGLTELAAWQKAHRWHPHQLRHAAATRIRRDFGLEAAQLALGHSSALVTDAIYAERDATKVAEIMKRIG